jgi:hypothetical protein
MAERHTHETVSVRADPRRDMHTVVGRTDAATQVELAENLLGSGAIGHAEFDHLKQKVPT